MPSQVAYSADIPALRLCPCFTAEADLRSTNFGFEPRLVAHSDARHPHDRVPPLRKFDPVATVVFPHSQRQTQFEPPERPLGWPLRNTVRRPKICPVMSINFIR